MQVSWFVDPFRRAPDELLAGWPALVETACAANGGSMRVTVAQVVLRRTARGHSERPLSFDSVGEELRAACRGLLAFARGARRPARPSPLPAREAYRLWAPSYETENAVTLLDERAVAALSPPVEGRALLDAGCGTGRRLPPPGVARRAVGVDLVPEMLQAGRARRPAGPPLIAGDITALPLRDASFDLVWCRLVAGHLPALDGLYRELARVCRPDGCVIVTDFHPAAARAGHDRTFRDAAGRVWAIEHHVHDAETHEQAAAAAGLALDARLDAAVGPEVRPFYERAGALDRYEAQLGLPLVLALRFTRRAGPATKRASSA